ncbi:phospholipid-transporting ATPase [Penicillium fimorum]|uniref:Phospholipid-transporting ATPase n=1 Tax=Penicillium fimorum TaxID=1882269 RepID=A0A9W9Y1R7_9EURO|nr:phospholipid-transporting ATPase [Penicillium fimorum]
MNSSGCGSIDSTLPDLPRPSTDKLDDLHSSPLLGQSKSRYGGLTNGGYGFAIWQPWSSVLLSLLDKVRSTTQTLRQVVSHAPLAASDGRRLILDSKRRRPLMNHRVQRPYVSNSIRSSRYTLWNFLPRQLVAQFSKTANFYFMIVAILQAIPNLSTTGNFTTFIPLMIFVSISMAKEAFDDFRRYQLDREENNRQISIRRLEGLHTIPSWQPARWSEVQVGDLIDLKRDHPVPADIVLIHVEGDTGVAHFETTALDGETSLKCKQPCPLIAKTYQSLETIDTIDMHLVVQDPNVDLHRFEGQVSIGDVKAPLTNNHIAYRESVLRNVGRVIGVAIYTGEECKIRMNANKSPRTKAPRIQAKVNRIILLVVCVVFILVLSCTLAYTQWFSKLENGFWYLQRAKVRLGPEFISYFIMFNTMIPLSLYTTLELVKIFQAFLLLQDVDLYDEDSNTPAQARTSTINEDLGQVNYIFTDKTGTLTQNIMELRNLSVAGRAYLHDPRHTLNVPATDTTNTRRNSLSQLTSNLSRTQHMIEFVQNNAHSKFSQKVKLLLLNIALCHTCFPEFDRAESSVGFQGVSPDEVALLAAARELGYMLLSRRPDSITLRILHDQREDRYSDEIYEVLDVIEFSTMRKRMSIIVRMPDRRICLFCKGADSVIRLRLHQNSLSQAKLETGTSMIGLGAPVKGENAKSDSDTTILFNIEGDPSTSEVGAEEAAPIFDTMDGTVRQQVNLRDDPEVAKRCFQHLNQFASQGLRTLLYGHRFLDDQTYSEWKRRYTGVQLGVTDRTEAIDEVGQQLEHQMELTGAIAIEDKLQKGVPEAVDTLRRANIKLWMLTGDKRETAVSIGHSCRLLLSRSIVISLDESNFRLHLADVTEKISKGQISSFSIVVEGSALSAFEHDGLSVNSFFKLAILADTVICCRASPKQKAFLVKTIHRYSRNATTLAIGDGANDIGMIQEANIGIGIAGKEGLQAARVSDYSIAEFRFLVKLLLVHGRWNYIRICKFTLATFWKEVVFYTTQAFYQRSNGYTGTSLYEPWGLSMFNTLFTSVSVVLLGVFTKDLSASTLLAFPELYATGQQNRCFNIAIYLGWTLMALCDAAIIYFIIYNLYKDTGTDIFSFGLPTYSACVIVVNLKLQFLEVYNKTITCAASLLVAIGGCFLWNIVLSFIYRFESGQGIYHVRWNFMYESGEDMLFWHGLVLAVLSVCLFEIAVATFRAWLFPTDVDLFQRYEWRRRNPLSTD